MLCVSPQRRAEITARATYGGKTGAVKELLNICPEVYALLVPYLKISRLDYDKFGNVATDGNGRAIMSDLEIPNFLTQDDISDI